MTIDDSSPTTTTTTDHITTVSTQQQVEKKVAPLKQQSIWRQSGTDCSLASGIAYFNEKPQHGLRYLIDSGTLSNNTEEIAKFLLANEELDRGKVGELLSSCDELCSQLREAFVDLQKKTFAGREFESALRLFLNTFGLPKEAQQIDRMLQIFGQKYYHENQNNTIFKDADAVYILAYSVIMLNTELHSPALSNRKRMSLKQFIKNNSSCGYDYPVKFQAKIYQSVKKNEIVFKKDDMKPMSDTDKKSNKKKLNLNPIPIRSMKQSVYRMVVVMSLTRTLL